MYRYIKKEGLEVRKLLLTVFYVEFYELARLLCY